MYNSGTIAQNRTWRKWKDFEHSIRASELYDTVELRAYKCKNDGYGELLAPFTIQLANTLEIKENARLLDVGSGIGLVGIDFAALTLCSVRGIEVREDLWKTSLEVCEKIARLNLNVSFHLGDATSDEFTFREADIVLCCNTLWSSENNYKLLQKLCLELPVGAKVVVLEKLGGHRDRAGSRRCTSNLLGGAFEMPPHEFVSPPNAVSWTNNPVNFYIYTKKKFSKSMAQELISERQRLETLELQKNKAKALALLKKAQKRKVEVAVEAARPASPLRGRDISTGRYVRTKPVVASPLKRGRGRPRKAVLQTTSPDRPSISGKRALIRVATTTEEPAAKRSKKDPPLKSPSSKLKLKTRSPKSQQTKTPSRTPAKVATPEPSTPPPYEPPTTRSKISSLASTISNKVSLAMQRISGSIVKNRKEEDGDEDEEVDVEGLQDENTPRGLRQRKFNSLLNDYIA